MILSNNIFTKGFAAAPQLYYRGILGARTRRKGEGSSYMPDRLETKCKDRSGKGSGCLALICSSLVSVIAHHYTRITPSTL